MGNVSRIWNLNRRYIMENEEREFTEEEIWEWIDEKREEEWCENWKRRNRNWEYIMTVYKKISKKKQKQYSEWFRKARKYYEK